MSDRFIWVFASNMVDKRDYSRTSINRHLSTYNGHFFLSSRTVHILTLFKPLFNGAATATKASLQLPQ